MVGRTRDLLRRNTIGVNFFDVANSQSPFGTPPATPPVAEPPISTAEVSGQVAAIPHAPDHGRYLPAKQPVTDEPPPEQVAAPKPRRRRSWFMAAALVLVIFFAAGFGLHQWTGTDKTDSTPAPSQPSRSDETVADFRNDDDAPLAHHEVFAPESLPDGYSLVSSQQLSRCQDAASPQIASLLQSSGCTQVVRAVLSPNASPHMVTVGVANLDSSRSAESAHATINSSGETAFHAADEAQPMSHDRGDTVLGFNTSGHFLLYAVVASTENVTAPQHQDEVQAIVTELVDDYLVDRLQQHSTTD